MSLAGFLRTAAPRARTDVDSIGHRKLCSSPYSGAEVALATKHGKEILLAPIAALLGLRLKTAHVDTDRLGTFSGEVPRVGTPREVAIAKARMGMATLGLELGFANEGSFGPLPTAPLMTFDQELFVFVDDHLGIVILEHAESVRTNFSRCSVKPSDDLRGFLEWARFPSHALVVRPNGSPSSTAITKGIHTREHLQSAILTAARVSADGLAGVETDMRAHFNPMRRRVIRLAAARLVRRIATSCPVCESPGWGVVEVTRGLPCEDCHRPTNWVHELIEGCIRCPARRTRPRPDRRSSVSAAHCSWCNP